MFLLYSGVLVGDVVLRFGLGLWFRFDLFVVVGGCYTILDFCWLLRVLLSLLRGW